LQNNLSEPDLAGVETGAAAVVRQRNPQAMGT
jgi:hypothetical protein